MLSGVTCRVLLSMLKGTGEVCILIDNKWITMEYNAQWGHKEGYIHWVEVTAMRAVETDTD